MEYLQDLVYLHKLYSYAKRHMNEEGRIIERLITEQLQYLEETKIK